MSMDVWYLLMRELTEFHRWKEPPPLQVEEPMMADDNDEQPPASPARPS